MSVAFRRDGDEEHLEPKFELPIPPGPNLVTAKGKEAIDERVAHLETRIADLTEETALGAAKRELRYWQTRQITAQIVPQPDASAVQIGTLVQFLLNGREQRFEIVGHDEADPANSRIAYSAPLGRALIGAEAGDLVDFGGKAEAIEVLAIEMPED